MAKSIKQRLASGFGKAADVLSIVLPDSLTGEKLTQKLYNAADRLDPNWDPPIAHTASTKPSEPHQTA